MWINLLIKEKGTGLKSGNCSCKLLKFIDFFKILGGVPVFNLPIVNNLINGHQINLFNDMFYTPIHINELLNNVHSLLNINSSGIFNVVSDHRISKYDFGILIAKKLNLDVDLIKMAKLSERKDLTVRPFDLSLSNEKLKKHLSL